MYRQDAQNTFRARWSGRLWAAWTSVLTVLVVVAGCATSHATQRQEDPPADPLRTASAESMYVRGTESARNGDYIRAEQYLSVALERGYPRGKVVPQLVKVCIAASRLRAGLAYAEPYLSQHPKHWPLRVLVATIRIAVRDYAEARMELERVVQHAPNQPHPHYLLATLLRDHFAEPAEVEQHFESYLKLEPRGVHSEEAQSYLEQASLESAVKARAHAEPSPSRRRRPKRL